VQSLSRAFSVTRLKSHVQCLSRDRRGLWREGVLEEDVDEDEEEGGQGIGRALEGVDSRKGRLLLLQEESTLKEKGKEEAARSWRQRRSLVATLRSPYALRCALER